MGYGKIFRQSLYKLQARGELLIRVVVHNPIILYDQTACPVLVYKDLLMKFQGYKRSVKFARVILRFELY